ncbi:MAG TPA: tetratricopeptide repeat protein, partial [Verrucomicrobiae bacterium]|nr:tetratricopeptide repeat protein [Verrucomicrobiae bacterium]
MRRENLIYVLLGLVTLVLFAPVAGHEFINCDDPDYVTDNPPVNAGLTGTGVVWAFTKSHASNWHPLTWISHMVDCQMFGLKPAGHHIVNLFFHVANTLLLFGILRRMTGAMWQSAFVAALFAWHPMHVESVAWVAERKDVLSTFFWLLTMLAYVRYAEESRVQSNTESGAPPDLRPSGQADVKTLRVNLSAELGKERRRSKGYYYRLTLVCFALGLLAKPMLVTLPFVLLLLDFWPLNRSTELNKANLVRLIWEKVPFFILAAVSSVITYVAQKSSGAMSTLEAVSLDYRINNSLVAYLRYVEKIFWPHDMAIFYPRPISWDSGLVMAGGIMLAAVTIAVVLWAKRRPYLAVGWLWFVGTLVPVIGLVQVGAASMADRYTYVPGIGLFIMVAWGLADLMAKWALGQTALRTASAVALAACVMVTSVQLKYWKDNITLYEHAIAVTSNNVLAYIDEGSALLLMGKTEEGIARLQQALAVKPDQWSANCGMAVALDGQGKAKEAIPYYREALRQRPDMPEMLNNMAWILAANPDPSLRNGPEAVEFGERACKLTHYEKPFLIGTLAAAYAEAGRFKEAV